MTDAADIIGPDTWRSLPEDAQLALADMTFQLGEGGVSEFHQMLGYLREGRYQAAAEAARNSLWHEQTPARCESVAELLEGCAETPPPEAA